MKIITAALFSLTAAFLTTYIILNLENQYFDPYKTEKEQYSSIGKTGENRIFLVGSSHVGRLNATFIQNYLLNHGKNYEVFNLAVAGDKPSLQLLSLKNEILLKPVLVVYGISFRDFESTQQNTSSISSFQTFSTVNSPLPDLHDLFVTSLYPITLNENFPSFENPQFLTLIAIDTLVEKPFPVSVQTLLTVWNMRADLQQVFPEVKNGNLDNLKKWAINYGWNETSLLYPLTPSNKIPYYQKSLIQTLNGITQNHTPFFKYQPAMMRIKNSTELNTMMENPDLRFKGFNSIDLEKNENALEQIVGGLSSNNVKVILFTTPQSKAYLDAISPKDKEILNSIVQKMHGKFGIETILLQDKYKNLNVWSDPSHMSTNSTISIYNEDIANAILKELG